MYDAVHSENVNTTLSEHREKISDSYAIIPQRKLSVKPMQFSLGPGWKIQNHKLSEIMITILDGPTANATASNSENGKNKISATEQFKFIKLRQIW
jgi:hypothetical protein